METRELWAKLVVLINDFGPDDQKVSDFIDAHHENVEFVELASLSCTLKRALIQEGSSGSPLIIRYTKLLYQHGGPNSKKARVFMALHADNAAFTGRAEVLNGMWRVKPNK